MTMTLIDISRPIHSGMPHWPGDTATLLQRTCLMEKGSSCNVSSLALSPHNGTHVDAPFHFQRDGATIDSLPLDTFLGPALVIEVGGHAVITPEQIIRQGHPHHRLLPRLLLKTESWNDPSRFPERWPLIAIETAGWLADQGVRLLGVDVPSVDPLESKDLPRHQALGAAGILILENLDLTGVAAGVYELMAFPLRIVGGDASPVRALLRTNGLSPLG